MSVHEGDVRDSFLSSLHRRVTHLEKAEEVRKQELRLKDKPALRDGLSLKRYMEDADPGELHSLLLHILERLNDLENP